jgi:hydroxymethylbilane synthase
MPVAALARTRGGKINLSAMIISLDGKKAVSLSKSASFNQALELGEDLALQALKKGGKKILSEIKNGQK